MPARPQPAARRPWSFIVLAALFLALVGVALFAGSMAKGFDHDEHQFIATAALLARDGLLPYVDYPYFHTPHLVFVYALLLQFTDRALLAARAFSALSAWTLVVLLFALTLRLMRGRAAWLRFGAAAGAVIVLIANPVFFYTSGRAWNHDAGTLLAFVGLLLLLIWQQQGKGPAWVFAAGAAAGLATGVRLSFVLLALPFGIAVLWAGGAQRWRAGLAFVLGFALGLLPALVLAAQAPAEFWFGNIGYPRLNTLFREQTGYTLAMTPGSKLAFVASQVFGSAAALGLLAFWLAATTLALAVGARRLRFAVLLTGATALTLLLAGLLATPSWLQYFYALMPFLLAGGLIGMAALAGRWQNALLIGFAVLVVISAVQGMQSYRLLRLWPIERWVTMSVHEQGEDIAGRVSDEGRVLTLAPIFSIEGGRRTYPAFATVPFVWRTAHLLAASERQRLGVIGPDELDAYLADQPPAAILVGYEGAVEAPFITYAEAHGYQPVTLADGATLWLRPAAP